MASSNFIFDTNDVKFLLKEWLDLGAVLNLDPYRGRVSLEDVDALVDVAYRISRDAISPANADADRIGPRLEGGRVLTPESFKKAYNTVKDAGLGAGAFDRQAETRLPLCMLAPLTEMMSAASTALPTFWGVPASPVTVLQLFASPDLQEKFLPRMFSGEWGGTMCLNEPGAGSDAGAISTRAFPTDQAGLYRIRGVKLFITAGDHDLTDNIVHLVLARPEGARDGAEGLAFFATPKYRLGPAGSLGEFNDVATVGLENKMGLKGSATCMLSFGDNDDCYGYLIGDPPGPDGIGQGLAQVLAMVNQARLGTGLMSVGTMAEAYYNAADYARQRIQGSRISDPAGARVPIIEHEDVRRMLLLQKSVIEACRALVYRSYFYLDLSRDSNEPEQRQAAEMMFQVTSPMCKAYPSDVAWPMIGEAIQTYGGYGFMEDYPPAQLARDVKVFSLWEGPNYLQSMALISMKFRMYKGQGLMAWLTEISRFIQANQDASGWEKEIKVLADSLADFQAILGALAGFSGAGRISMAALYATRIMHASSMLYCGMLSLDMAILAEQKLNSPAEALLDADFYRGKIAAGRFYALNVLPGVATIRRMIELEDDSALEIPTRAL